MNAQHKALDKAESALLAFLDATEWNDVEEVGGKPLVIARRQAVKALPIIRKALEAADKSAPIEEG